MRNQIRREGIGDVLSRSAEFGDTVYLQGMVAPDKSADVAGQTRQVLVAIDDALAVHGTDKSRILQAQIWMEDLADRPAMNAVWTAWLAAGTAPPRACVQAGLGSSNVLVEIMVTAAR